MRISLLCLLIFGVFQSATAQHASQDLAAKRNGAHFRISAALAHTYLPETTIDGKKTLVLPSFALDLEYWANHHWGIGMHNDLELLNFEVKDKEGVYIEREFPVLLTLDALWKVAKEAVIFLGPGIELEPNQNYFVFRMGLEYELHFAHYWDIAPIVFYDARKGAYNTFSIGLGIGHQLGGR